MEKVAPVRHPVPEHHRQRPVAVPRHNPPSDPVAGGIQDRQNHLSVSGREEEIAVAAPGTDLNWPRCRYPDACPCTGFYGRNVLESRPPRGGYNPVGLRKIPPP